MLVDELPNEARLRKRRGWETVGAGLGWPPKRGTVGGRRYPVFFLYEFVLRSPAAVGVFLFSFLPCLIAERSFYGYRSVVKEGGGGAGLCSSWVRKDGGEGRDATGF